MKRSGPIKRTAFKRKPAARIAQRSARRVEMDAARAEVRAEVLARAGARHPADLSACQYREVIPEFPCGWLPDRRQLEVDELAGGSARCVEWLNPDRCRAGCPVHHEIKTDGTVLPDGTFLGKRLVLERLAEFEGRP